ncbi:pentatricopeptide repeat-containing protein At4g14170 isoform X2 [Jatropha curcas]|nr:pentatricopeptide repeat-containing protein At4g14170 isoform X2 [Jatropha curcas]
MHIALLFLARKESLLFNKLFFSTTTSINPSQTSLISHYFSLLHSSPNPTHLRHLHARLLRTSLYDNVILSSKLVLMYSCHGKLIPHSLSVFFHMPYRNIFSWNIIMGEFSRSDFPEKSIDLFLQMRRESDVRPDDFSFPLVLRACAGSGMAELGTSVHALCLRMGWSRDAVLWTAMLAGYAQHGEPVLGLQVFEEMVNLGIKLDGVVMVSLLLVFGRLGWLKQGKSVHGWCVRNCLGLELSLGNAIVDVYVKCAILGYAHRVFDRMSERDVVSWSSLILGYGLSGNVSVALELFDQMHLRGVRPNDVTFLGVLSACAHGGLVEQARVYFKMIPDCGLVAELKHYACMVDCMGRAGLLEEAERFIEEMPIEPDEAVLGAVLAGCRVHNNVDVGERIAKRLIRLKPEKAGYYVLLSNMYAAVGRFDEAEIVRDFMKEKSLSKVPGCSLIESKSYFPSSTENEVLDCF